MQLRSFPLFFALMALALSLTGCTGGGGGPGFDATSTTSSLDDADLGVIEAALVADRLDAAAVTAQSPSLLAAILPVADLGTTDQTVTRRGRRYQAGRRGQGIAVQRGTGGCPVTIALGGTATAAGDIAGLGMTVTKLASGGYQLVRGNGESFELSLPAEGSTTGTITENGRTWQVVFGTTAGEPLATLTNTRSGRILQILEDDAGTLTVSVQGTPAGRGAWRSDGTLDITGIAGQRQYRHRHGKTV